MLRYALLFFLLMVSGCAMCDHDTVPRFTRMRFMQEGKVENGTMTLRRYEFEHPGMTADIICLPRDAATAGPGMPAPTPASWRYDGGNSMLTSIPFPDGCQRLFLVIRCPHNTIYDHLAVVYDEVIYYNGHTVKPLWSEPDCHCYEPSSGAMTLVRRY